MIILNFIINNHNYLKYSIIIFEVQKKRSNEKLTRRNIRKISFPSYKTFCFLEFLTPFTLGGHNFLISNLFSTILSVLDAPRGGLQVCFAHQKQ